MVHPLRALVNGNFKPPLRRTYHFFIVRGTPMLSAISARSWYPWPLFLDQEKTIRDREVIKKIIRKTIPENTSCTLLDVGCADGDRLKEAVSKRPLLQGIGLVRRGEDVPVLWKEPAERQQVRFVAEDLFQFRTSPEFDVIYLFERLAHCPENQRKKMLQYCKMLLKPGGMFVTASAEKSRYPALQPAVLQDLLQRAGFYKVRSYRITASLRLLTGVRINKNL